MAQCERLACDEELSKAVSALARRFVQRWDLYPRQLEDGRYICVHQPLYVSDLLAHLSGEVTLGTYLLNRESQARFVVLDADGEASFQRLVSVAPRLTTEGAPCYPERSRRGGHLWFFFVEPVAGREARAFSRGVMAAHKLEGIELYPKQDELKEGPGSLIRMPFGVHRMSRRRYSFYTPGGQPLAPTIHEQVNILSFADPVSERAFRAYQIASGGPLEQKAPLVSETTAATLSARIKGSVSVLEFVSQYVALSPSGVGRCPFHDDEHASFSVNDQGNYWHCFAGCEGGSVIDFWMKWRKCEFTAAVTELAEMVLP